MRYVDQSVSVINPSSFALDDFVESLAQAKIEKCAPFIFLAGASGTGKTTLAKKIVDSAGKQGLNGKFYESVVRGFYEDNSVSDEISMLNAPIDYQQDFQLRLFYHYLNRTNERIKESITNKYDFSIFDRSVFDHLGYANMVGIDIDPLKGDINGIFQNISYCLMFIRYPQPWSNIASDNFRHTGTNKNKNLSDKIERLICRY